MYTIYRAIYIYVHIHTYMYTIYTRLLPTSTYSYGNFPFSPYIIPLVPPHPSSTQSRHIRRSFWFFSSLNMLSFFGSRFSLLRFSSSHLLSFPHSD